MFFVYTIIFPFLFSFLIFPYKAEKKIAITQDSFPYQMTAHGYLWSDVESLFSSNIIAKIFNLNLGIDWYNVCIKNNAEVLKNGDVTVLKELPQPLQDQYLMYVEIFPFKKNQILSDQYSFLSKRNQHFIPKEVNGEINQSQEDNIGYSATIEARQGEEMCFVLSLADEGFFYAVPGFKGFGSISIPPSANEEDYMQGVSLNIGKDKYGVRWNESRFFISIHYLALWLNRFLFILAWVAFALLLTATKDKFIQKA